MHCYMHAYNTFVTMCLEAWVKYYSLDITTQTFLNVGWNLFLKRMYTVLSTIHYEIDNI